MKKKNQEGHGRKSQKGEQGQQCVLINELMNSLEMEVG